jgi:hypothetical protein
LRRNTAIWLGVGLACCLGLWLAWGGVDLDRRIAARPGEKLSIDMQLAWGLAFDKGSLTISSHDADEVRVVVDTSGWGEYAVRVDVTEVAGGVSVEGRVDGFLHWLFGGPKVDLTVWVPVDYSVDARIAGGPLRIEDLKGVVEAQVEGDSLIVRRTEGELRLVAKSGDISAEDIEGSLDLESQGSDVEVSGVRGSLRVRSGRGRAEISSVTGDVDVETSSGRIEVDRIDGGARLVSDSGRIEVEAMEGDLEVRTSRGRIQVDGIEGRVLARSGRGRIEVRFAGDPSGVIETQRGSIDIEVPQGSGFDLEASTARGSIEVDSDLDFQHAEGAARSDRVAAYRELGRQIAKEVTAKLHQNVRRGLETGNWDQDWSFGFAFEKASHLVSATSPEEPARSVQSDGQDGLAGFGGRSDRGDRDVASGWNELGGRLGPRSVQIRGRVNGGGPPLLVQTQRGSIEIDDR